MADVINVKELKVETVTVKLTTKLLKQFLFTDNILEYKDLVRPVKAIGADSKEYESFNPAVLGWVHGSVLEAGETYWHWLIVRKPNGEYLRVRVTLDAAKKYAPRQLYIT